MHVPPDFAYTVSICLVASQPVAQWQFKSEFAALQAYNQSVTQLMTKGYHDLRDVVNLNLEVFSIYDKTF